MDTNVQKICEDYKELKQLSWYRKNAYDDINKYTQLSILKVLKLVQADITLDVKHVNILASSILADFWWFKLEDLYLALKRITNGEFKVYNRLDYAVFMEALKEYDEIKQMTWARVRDSKHGHDKEIGSSDRGRITVEQYWRNLGHK